MLGLWPATLTRPKLAFTMELMNAINFLVRECQTSLHDVASLLQCIGKQQPQESPILVDINTVCIVLLNDGGVLLQDKDI